jgi:hypothetical protein
MSADMRAKQSRMIKRLEAKKQSKLKEIRTAQAWNRVEETNMEEEQKRRELDMKWQEKAEQLRIRDIEKEIRQRKVQLKEKEAMRQMHMFYPMIKEAEYTGRYDKLFKSLDSYMDRCFSEPVLQMTRPHTAHPGSRIGSRSGSKGDFSRTEGDSAETPGYSSEGLHAGGAAN